MITLRPLDDRMTDRFGASWTVGGADVAQVNHILRAAAHAARAKELERAAAQDAAQQALERATKRAPPVLLSVLSRYPATSLGTTRVAELVHCLDTSLRAQRFPERDQR